MIPASFVFGLHWRNPCRASMLGYWLLDACGGPSIFGTKSHEFFEMGKKLAILTGNFYFFSVCFKIGSFVISVLQILCQMSIRGYLRSFWKLSEDIPKRRAGSIYHISQIYRHIQVMSTLNNVIQQNRIIVVLMSAGILLQSLSIFMVVRHPWNWTHLLPLGIYTMLLTDCTLAIIVLTGGMANIYSDSKLILSRLRTNILSGNDNLLPRIELKWARKFYKSCDPLKVKFGSTNFFEANTPLNCMNFANGLTVNILLLTS